MLRGESPTCAVRSPYAYAERFSFRGFHRAHVGKAVKSVPVEDHDVTTIPSGNDFFSSPNGANGANFGSRYAGFLDCHNA